MSRGLVPSARVASHGPVSRVSARGLCMPGLARAGPCRATSGRRSGYRRAGPCLSCHPIAAARGPGHRRAVGALAVGPSGHPAPISAAVGPVPGLSARAVGLWSAAAGPASGRARDQRRCQFRRFDSYVCYRGSSFALYQSRFGQQVFAIGRSRVLIIQFLQNHNPNFANFVSRGARRVELAQARDAASRQNNNPNFVFVLARCVDRRYCDDSKTLQREGKPVKIAIEMQQGRGYGFIHAAGCRDLRDQELLGEANTVDEANELAYEFTGWDDDGDGFRLSPCASKHLKKDNRQEVSN